MMRAIVLFSARMRLSPPSLTVMIVRLEGMFEYVPGFLSDGDVCPMIIPCDRFNSGLPICDNYDPLFIVLRLFSKKPDKLRFIEWL